MCHISPPGCRLSGEAIGCADRPRFAVQRALRAVPGGSGGQCEDQATSAEAQPGARVASETHCLHHQTRLGGGVDGEGGRDWGEGVKGREDVCWVGYVLLCVEGCEMSSDVGFLWW